MSESEHTRPASATRLPYRAIDADGHYYEPHDAFARHLETRFQNRALHVRKSLKDGFGRLYADWPHPEGLAEPLEFADKLIGRASDDDMRKVMRGTTAQLIGMAA